ncbi:hypothetical protein L2K70_11175 [Nocardioides KLBMP 9356]|uniref:Uncharacterized protein n=1 Tax=Nocardioides potassii TaxID=2911371 RepID=A0ABS9HCM6_9ACTN|nr:hypothetical protein [Nocardioides potassii]MCF6378164.1 hypothetical protein [Nocardioides potassii]
MGWRVARHLGRWRDRLTGFNDLERERAAPLDGWFDNLIVPSDERVAQGGVWVVEVFPPSMYGQLVKSLRRNGWDRDDFVRHHDSSNTERVEQARAGRGWTWWRLGEVVGPRAASSGPGTYRDVLPPAFDSVDLRATQVGTSLTIVSALFLTSEIGMGALDETWHATHEPRVTWRGLRRPTVEGRHFAAIRAGQSERQRLHDSARDWLAERCAGSFATSPGRHPVIDMTLFDRFDPCSESPSRDLREALRALGLADLDFGRYESPQMPGLALVQSPTVPSGYDVLHNCWGAVGQADRVVEVNEWHGYPQPDNAADVAHRFNDELRSFAQYLAVHRYLDNLGTDYAIARDAASRQHRRFRSRELRLLRRRVLTTGLDLATVGPDTARMWDEPWRSFVPLEILWKEADAVDAGESAAAGVDYLRELAGLRSTAVDELRVADAAYRDALVTAASLGASLDANATGRWALIVSGVSLFVATVTLLIADVGSETLWGQLMSWLRA